MSRHLNRSWLPNDTPIVYAAGTVHLAESGSSACNGERGRPTVLVLAWVYSAVQWCPRCFRNGRP